MSEVNLPQDVEGQPKGGTAAAVEDDCACTLWAVVDANGNLVRDLGAHVSSRLNAGVYEVRFNEVFSPGIRTPLKAAVDAAGQACSESSRTSSAAPRNRLPPEALDARPTLGADLQRCPSCPSLDGESW